MGAGRYFDEEKIFYDMKKRNETVAPRRRPTGGKRATEINMQRQISAATEMLKGEVERLITNELLTETKQIELLQAIDRHCFGKPDDCRRSGSSCNRTESGSYRFGFGNALQKIFEVSMIIGDEQLKTKKSEVKVKEFSYKRVTLLFCFAVLIVLSAIGAVFGAGTTASAVTYTTPKYKTYGTTTEGTTTTGGSPSNFTIYMHGSSTSGTVRCTTTGASIGAMCISKLK